MGDMSEPLPFGWCEWDAFRLYERMAAKAKPGDNFVEVGVAFGRSATFMARRLPPGVNFWLVDPWDAPWLVERRPGETPFSAFMWEVLRNASREEIQRMRVLRTPSVVAARMFDPMSCQFVFIDGDHTYEAVWADIMSWLPCIARGGILAGHDYGEANHPGVSRAVDEAFAGWTGPHAVKVDGGTWWVEVP